jgi:hypothetical protein
VDSQTGWSFAKLGFERETGTIYSKVNVPNPGAGAVRNSPAGEYLPARRSSPPPFSSSTILEIGPPPERYYFRRSRSGRARSDWKLLGSHLLGCRKTLSLQDRLIVDRPPEELKCEVRLRSPARQWICHATRATAAPLPESRPKCQPPCRVTNSLQSLRVVLF